MENLINSKIKFDHLNWLLFFRIFLILFILIHYFSVFPDFNSLYSVNGLIPYSHIKIFVPDYVINLPKIIIFLNNYNINETTSILIFHILFVSFCLLILFGIKYRFLSIFLLLLHIILVKSNPYYSYGVDYFTSISIFYLIIIPNNKTEKSYKPFKKLFQIHLCIIYFFAGFEKALGHNWWNGESIWKAVNLPFASGFFDFSFLLNFPVIFSIIGISTVFLELTYPIFIWSKRFRNIWLNMIILLHIGIAFILNLYFFSGLMIILNLTLKYSFNDEKTNSNI